MAEVPRLLRSWNKHVAGFAPKLTLLLLGVFLLVASQRSTHATQAATGDMQGSVSIGSTGDGSVREAKVVVIGDSSIRSTVTDDQGRFAFHGLEPGVYLVEARYFGLQTQMNVEVEAGAVAQVALQLDGGAAKR